LERKRPEFVMGGGGGKRSSIGWKRKNPKGRGRGGLEKKQKPKVVERSRRER